MYQKIRYLFLISISACFLFLGFIFILEKLLTKDISLEPILPAVNPDFQAKNFSYRPAVYLISYADGPEVYFKNQNTLAASAINKGIDFILNYRRSHLDPAFVKQHSAIFSQAKGAGLWLWKPWIISKTLETIAENDVVIYTDTGVLFREPVTPLLELVKEHEIILLEYDLEKYWGKPINVTKREIFLALECDTENCHQGRHVWAGTAIFRNTQKSRDFVKKWLSYCSNEKLLTDEFDPTIQYPQLVRTYHDEAILNTLYNKDPDGKYLLQSKIFFQKYATWHHRSSGVENYSLLMASYNDISSLTYIMQDDLLNNYFTVLLREFFRSKKSK